MGSEQGRELAVVATASGISGGPEMQQYGLAGQGTEPPVLVGGIAEAERGSGPARGQSLHGQVQRETGAPEGADPPSMVQYMKVALVSGIQQRIEVFHQAEGIFFTENGAIPKALVEKKETGQAGIVVHNEPEHPLAVAFQQKGILTVKLLPDPDEIGQGPGIPENLAQGVEDGLVVGTMVEIFTEQGGSRGSLNIIGPLAALPVAGNQGLLPR